MPEVNLTPFWGHKNGVHDPVNRTLTGPPMSDFGLPEFPQIDPELLDECRKSGDFSPALFEWYQYVSVVCNFFARFQPDSPDLRNVPPLHYAVLRGKLNRCSRLMHANAALSYQGSFGETTAIIDRCIFETVVKIRWLCGKGDDESFERLVLDGLKSEVKFKKGIEDAIKARGGDALVVEARMLRSIDNYLKTVPTTEDEVVASKQLQKLDQMLSAAELNDMAYIVGQRIGSHHVHGTWPSLFLHYLEERDGILVPTDSSPTHQNQYVLVMFLVIGAMQAFVNYVVADDDGRRSCKLLLEEIHQRITEINNEVIGKDFDVN